jgi:hypothetical protein
LQALCITNKLFNACFTPFLYKKLAVEVIAREDMVDKIKFQFDMDKNPHLKHTRYLSLVAIDIVPSLSRNADVLDGLLSQMPGLEHLE